MSRQPTGTEIAIVGMAGRFPGARDVDELWRNLAEGVESIRRLDAGELADLGVGPEIMDDPVWVPAVSQLDGYAGFDASFFGINPREAETMDPQHRVFLELAWQALEDAGHDPERFRDPVGVFAGATLSTYLLYNLARSSRTLAGTDPLQLIVGNAGDSLATRVSYKLDLKGPSHAVQCACSTSLVAVHLAARALLEEECDMALAGGVSINVGHGAGYRYVRDSILSPDGHCRPFDANAAGTVFASGAGIVVLRRLEDALADGDRVRAVILGSAVNNDGALKVGFTAPSVEGQAAVISEALAVADVDAESIGYIEAHGTGTALGDPVEIQALTRAFRTETDRRGFCALGSVKSNLGHLDIAAGVTGLIKTVLSLEHGQIPPTLHFEAPNPKIDLAASPVYVASKLADWPAGDAPRRAGVSSFGLGGTNAHVILEEAPAARAAAAAEKSVRPWELLTLSAKTPAALDRATARLAEHLRAGAAGGAATDLADAAYTLHVGRRAFPERRVVVCSDLADGATSLEALDPARVATGSQGAAPPAVVFLFPGQGAQHPGMARELYESEPLFRAEVDRCLELLDLLDRGLGETVRRVLLAAPDDGEAGAALDAQPVTQCALFVVEVALARLWMSWGITPRAMLGHSVGEYAAAHLAGVFRLEDALAVVAERGRLMAESEAGAMLSVSLSEEALAPFLGERSGGLLELAAVNAPELSTVTGPAAAIDSLAAELERVGVRHRRLRISTGAHSALMEGAARELVERMRALELQAPSIPFVSNVTGQPITDAEATDPEYWGRQLRSPVRFADGLATLGGLVRSGKELIGVEAGPGRTLTVLAEKSPKPLPVFASLHHPKETVPDMARLLTTLGRLWVAGAEVDWQGFHQDRRSRRTGLPAYPFEHQRFWVEPDAAGTVALPGIVSGAGLRPVVEEAPLAAASRPAAAGALVELATETERTVARIWQEVLGIERVGAGDNFYDLGGHSLLATQVASRLRQELGADLSLERVLEAPTVAGMAGAVDEVLASVEASPGLAAGNGQGDLVRAEPDGPAGPIPRQVDPTGEALVRAPLSFAQERMWFLQSMDRDTTAYNLTFGVTLSGDLDLPALAAAFRALCRRHRTLTTTFAVEDGSLVQILGDGSALEVPVVDLGALPEERRARAVHAAAAAEHSLRFDLARGPLFRVVVVRTAPAEHACLLSMHHIVSDGWSMGVLVREVAALYGTLSGRDPNAGALLGDLPIEYADYAAWQRQWLSGDVLQAHLDYWRGQLADLPGPLELVTDRPRARAGGLDAAVETVFIPPDLKRRLEVLSRDRGATLFVALLAAFEALLYRATGATDLVVGTPIAGRNRGELEGLIGFFLNTLVLRTRFAPHEPFSALLDRVRRTAFGAYSHQDAPLESLLRGGDDTTGAGQAGIDSLFRVMFVFQNVPSPALEVAGLSLAPLESIERDEDRIQAHLGTAVFDLTLGVEESEGGLAAGMTYNSRLFDRRTVADLLARYRDLLEVVATDPERPVHLLGLAEEAEVEQLRSWSAPSAQSARTERIAATSVVEQIVARCAETPDAIAVLGGGRHLTYGELGRRAEGLKRRLLALRTGGPGGQRPAIGPDVRVALCLERSPEMIVAVLGVLATGAAYVPVDPTYPPERLELILADSGARAVVTTAALAEHFGGFVGLGVEPVLVDGAAAGGGARDTLRPVRQVPLTCAYLIYTSGSTGRPKAVVVVRRSLDGFVTAARELYGIAASDRVLQFASISFDTSAEEIYPTLTAGGTLVLRGDAMLASPAIFLDACIKERVTVIDLPTAYWHELVGTLEQDERTLGSPARLVILGGERVVPERLTAGMAHVDPSLRLLNTYGPTEAAVVATASSPLGSPDALLAASEGREAAIGRALGHVTAWVVDSGLRRVPVGVPGELVLGGAGIARCYLGRRALTAECFVPDPFVAESAEAGGSGGERLYRTGDRVRWLPSGELQFLGRIDQQVKIRGFRVEPGEVESVLRTHPRVADAVVDARQDAGGQASLVAWVVPRLEVVAADAAADGAPSLAEALRAFCEGRLPAYMVPAAFVRLETLPLTRSGKVDRRALPAPSGAQDTGAGDSYREPETEAEEVVAEIFGDVLGVGPVGAEADFFRLGGHSLLLPRVLHRVREAFDVDVPLKALYDDPTVAGLALAIEELILAEIEAMEQLEGLGGEDEHELEGPLGPAVAGFVADQGKSL